MTKPKYQIGDRFGQWTINGKLTRHHLTVYYLHNLLNGTWLTVDEDTLTRIFGVVKQELINEANTI